MSDQSAAPLARPQPEASPGRWLGIVGAMPGTVYRALSLTRLNRVDGRRLDQFGGLSASMLAPGLLAPDSGEHETML